MVPGLENMADVESFHFFLMKLIGCLMAGSIIMQQVYTFKACVLAYIYKVLFDQF